MDGLIVYGSKYGTTRRYAEELSRLTGLPAIPCGEFHRLAEGSILVYLGALYAGGVLGLKQTVKGLSLREGQRLIVATVGLADPKIPQNRAHICAALQKQLHWFHWKYLLSDSLLIKKIQYLISVWLIYRK